MLRARISGMIPVQIEARLLVWMEGLALAVAAGAAASGHFRFASGFMIGAAIALLGFVWLRDAARKALDSGSGRISKMLVLKLLIRYPLLFGAIYFFFRTEWLPGWAVLGGLSIPLAGAVAECLYQIKEMVFSSRPSRKHPRGMLNQPSVK